MSTTSLTAAEVMDRAAALMNDPAKTDYTYVAQLVYLNMAIDELVESLEETNSSPTNQTSATITIPVGMNRITPMEDLTLGVPHYPFDLVEIQEVLERTAGTSDGFVPLGRREFLQEYPVGSSLLYWIWEDQQIKFNPNGANSIREVQLRYVRQAISQASGSTSIIGTINARSYLSYKTASFCAMYIGENETRAIALESQAERALERLTSINNKGRQQIATRHRPFRAGFKARGGF
jgi:hypothetical protein